MQRFFAPALLATLAVVGILAASSWAAPLQQAGCGSGPCGYLPIVIKPESTLTATAQPTVTPTDVPGLPKFKNPDFEQGHTGWTEIPGNAIITQFSGITPHSGQWLAHLGGEDSSTDELQQTISLPAAPVYLRYARQIASRTDVQYDFIISANGSDIMNESIGDITDTNGQWEIAIVDLSAYAGQTVLLRFHVQTVLGAGAQVHIYLDDIALSSHS